MDETYKILVIDDDVEMCELLSDVLKGEGWSVMSISDSLEASKDSEKGGVRCHHHRPQDERLERSRPPRGGKESGIPHACDHYHGLRDH